MRIGCIARQVTRPRAGAQVKCCPYRLREARAQTEGRTQHALVEHMKGYIWYLFDKKHLKVKFLSAFIEFYNDLHTLDYRIGV